MYFPAERMREVASGDSGTAARVVRFGGHGLGFRFEGLGFREQRDGSEGWEVWGETLLQQLSERYETSRPIFASGSSCSSVSPMLLSSIVTQYLKWYT